MVVIPVSLLQDMEQVPRDRHVALLMRHSARHPILDPREPYLAALTEDGVQLAENLGQMVGRRFLPGRLLSAPVGRCLDTVSAIARGAGWTGEPRPDERLSHPFIEPAWSLVANGGINGSLPGQVHVTLDLLLEGTAAGLDLAVTHDTIVGAVVGGLLKAPVTGEHWPAFLEGLFLWRDQDRVLVRWRGALWDFGKDYR